MSALQRHEEDVGAASFGHIVNVSLQIKPPWNKLKLEVS